MKTKIALALMLAPPLLFAQTLVSVTASHTRLPIGDDVELVVELAGQGVPWCGLEINFGDGEFREVRVDTSPFKLRKHYLAPGNYAVRATGSFVRRGLKSAFACSGSSQTVLLAVVDPAEELKAKREMDDKALGLARRERELQEHELQLAALQRREREEAGRSTVANAASKAARGGRDAVSPSGASKPASAASATRRKDDTLHVFGIGAPGQ